MDNLTEVVNSALVEIYKAAKANDLPKARKIIMGLLNRDPGFDPSAEHQARMVEIGDDTIALCRYLGELAQTPETIERRLGRQMNEKERRTWDEGKADRAIEVRAIELSRLRRGKAGPEHWMKGR